MPGRVGCPILKNAQSRHDPVLNLQMPVPPGGVCVCRVIRSVFYNAGVTYVPGIV